VSEKKHPTSSNHISSWGIFIGLIIGSLIGGLFHQWGDSSVKDWILINVIQPVGTIFLRSLFMVIVPLVAGSLLIGIVNLGKGALLINLGWKVALF